MFARASLTSRPVLISAAALGTSAAIYYVTRPAPTHLESSMATKTVTRVATQIAPDVKSAAKKTFTSPLYSKELRVAKVEQVSHDTKRITFHLPSEDEVSGIGPSAAVLTQHTPAGKWLPVLRPYTPIHDLNEPGTLQLLVKQYPNGRASTYLHSLAPGSTLSVRGPLPSYGWKASTTPRDVLLVAGGAGITPIYSLAKGILSNPEDKTRIQLLWGVNGTRDIVLGRELAELERNYPSRFQVTYAVSGPESKSDVPLLRNEYKYRSGYVTKALLEEAIQRCEKGSFGDEKGTKVFLCGPPSMEEGIAGKKGFFGMGATTGVLAELGVDSAKVHRF